MKARLFCIGILITAGALLAGCASLHPVRVRPWERGHLADYAMDPKRDPLGDAMLGHVYESRENSSGGRAVGGAGCGCN
jgi:hypothetical protein